MKFTVQFYDAFYPSLDELTIAEKGAVMSALAELTQRPDSPGLNVHRVGDAGTKCWSARINDDTRLIFFRVEQIVVPAYVDHHDAAYKWAEGRALDVHPDTGAAQIVIVGERFEEIVKRVVRREEYDPMAAKPFSHLTDAELLEYGTPRAWLEPIRGATVEAFLEDIGDALPDEAAEFLMAVAGGEAPPPPPQRGKNPFTHPDAKRRFFVVESDDDLQRAVKLAWEDWMLYLHLSQREPVGGDFAGPARVAGGPAIGESVVAVHRAARLAREGRGRVLLTSFSGTPRRQGDDRASSPPRERCGGDRAHLDPRGCRERPQRPLLAG